MKHSLTLVIPVLGQKSLYTSGHSEHCVFSKRPGNFLRLTRTASNARYGDVHAAVAGGTLTWDSETSMCKVHSYTVVPSSQLLSCEFPNPI